MPVFTVTGDIDPFLHVSLHQGESIFCESDAMVMMEETLDLSAQMQGGLMQSVMRTMANGESFFQQKITATRGDGDCLLSPSLPGAMEVLEVGETQYCLADEAYVAASEGVEVRAQSQGMGNALFGGTGGFFIGRSNGRGQLVVSGFGALFTLDVTPEKKITIDNGHVIAWDSRLQYRLTTATKKSGGLLNNLVNSVTSGEGIVLQFSGQGKVVVCSRNRGGFVSWLSSKINRR